MVARPPPPYRGGRVCVVSRSSGCGRCGGGFSGTFNLFLKVFGRLVFAGGSMISWQELPADQYLGWGWKQEEERLEQELQHKRYQRLEQDDYDPKVDEEIAELEAAIEAEEDGIAYTKEVLKDAAAEAERRNAEAGLLSAEEAQQVDGFYYVHAQTWYPILDHGIGVDEALQTVSERVLDVEHAADAYDIDRQVYEEITGTVKEPLQQYILFGEQEQALVDELAGFMSRDDARGIVGDIEAQLYGSPYSEEYADVVEMLQDEVGMETVPRDLEKGIGRLAAGEDIITDMEAVLAEYTDEPDAVVERLREMQQHLGNKARARLADMVGRPDATDVSRALSAHYTTDWPYDLAVYWEAHGEPDLMEKEAVHSRWGRIAAGIKSHYYRGKQLLPKGLVDQLAALTTEELPAPRYWNQQGTPMKEPVFPIGEYERGMLYGTVHDGMTTRRTDQIGLRYKFSPSTPTADVRRQAYRRFDRLGNIQFEEKPQEESLESLNKFGGSFASSDTTERVYVNLPGVLDTISRVDGADTIADVSADWLLDQFTDDNFVRGYLDQVVWDCGVVENGGIQLRLPESSSNLVGDAVDYADIPYRIQHSSGRPVLYFPVDVVEQDDELRAFRDAYREAVAGAADEPVLRRE